MIVIIISHQITKTVFANLARNIVLIVSTTLIVSNARVIMKGFTFLPMENVYIIILEADSFLF